MKEEHGETPMYEAKSHSRGFLKSAAKDAEKFGKAKKHGSMKKAHEKGKVK